MSTVNSAAPEIGRLLLAGLPPAEIVAMTDARGRFRLEVPVGAPYVLGASVLRRTSAGRQSYCWMVPVRLAMGADLETHLDAENLLVSEAQAKDLARALHL